MAKGFNLTAQINLRGPTNLKPIVADIRRQLGSISTDVNVKLNPQTAKSINVVTARLKSMNDILATARGNADALSSSLSGLSNSLSTISSSGGKAVASISKTGTGAKAAAQNIKQASTAMEEFGKQSFLAIKRFAAFSVVSGAIYKLVNAINTGFSAFINFDKQLVKLQQVTGKGAIGLKNLENQITSLATSLGVSSESLIEVASTLAQAGLNAEDTRIALSALAKTELAPSFDSLTETTEGAIAALRQFELQAGDLEAALGSINAVAAAFAVESSDIITAIQRTGGVFAAASKGVSEGKDALNEFIAVFTSVRATTRESAETIATGLRTIFTRIQRGKTIEALKEYGVVLTDLEGKFVGPFEAVKRLSEGLKLLDPRDLRFSQIVEELGGFRQIGKVIPLIQQFSEAQKALRVAQTGQSSLTDAQVIAQKSLANQIAKVREQFLALIRDVGKSATFQAITKIVLGLTSAFISLAGAFKPILPFLAILATIKGVKAIGEFGSGFFGGFKGGSGSTAKDIGSNISSTLSGTKEKERSAATARASEAISQNTKALTSLTAAVQSLQNTISNRANTTLADGGKVLGFNKGGLVPGNGGGDTVPAYLEGGEIVMNRKAVQKYGAGNLLKMNKYADGGVVIEKVRLPNQPITLKEIESDKQISASAKGAIKGVMFERDFSKAYGNIPVGIDNQFPDINDANIAAKVVNGAKKLELKYTDSPDNIGRYKKGLADYNRKSEYKYSSAEIPMVTRANAGGLIQQFKDGSVGGLRFPIGRGVTGPKGARSRFKELSQEEILKLSTSDLLAYGKALAEDIFTTGGAGMSIGNEFIEVPSERIIPELEPYLMDYMGKKGFWREKIAPFGKPTQKTIKQSSMIDRKTALEAQVAKQADEVAARNQQWTQIREGSDIDKYLLSTLTDPILSDYKTVRKGESLSKPFHNTRLRQSVNKALEEYDNFDYSPANIDKLVSGMAAKRFAAGGLVQRFVDGGVAEPLSDEQIETRLGLLGGPQGIKAAIGIDRLNALVREKVRGESSAAMLLKLPTLRSKLKSERGSEYRDFISSAIRESTGATENLQNLTNQALSNYAGVFGGAGMYQDGNFTSGKISLIPDPNKKRAVDKLKGPTSIEIIPATLAQDKVMKQARLQASKARKDDLNTQIGITTSQTATDIAQQYGAQAQLGRISEFNKQSAIEYVSAVADALDAKADGSRIFLDFDKTLAYGADTIGQVSGSDKIDLSAFSDINKVKKGLAGATLSGLSKKLISLSSDMDKKQSGLGAELLKRLFVVSARPSNTMSLIAQWLNSKGLNIPGSNVIGVGGTGLSESDIAVNKAREIIARGGLEQGSVFVDDDPANLKQARAQGIISKQYGATMTPDFEREATQEEGLKYQDIVRQTLTSYDPALASAITINKQGQSLDFPNGLGPLASTWFDEPRLATIPTDVKRTITQSKVIENIANYLRIAKGYAFGGQVDGPGFEETKQKIIDKYPNIDFRISKRKQGRGFGYNLMGALKTDGGLLKSKGLKFEQPQNLQQLIEASEKMANDLLNPRTLALGGLAEATDEMQGLMRGLYGNRQSQARPEAKPQKNFGKIGLRSSASEITATYFKNAEREGFVSAKKASGNLYTIGLSKASKGYGPRLYDVVMEAATAAGGMLTSDRNQVSDAARAVWAYYFNNRSDVKKTPLDPSQWTKHQNYIDPKLYGKKETWPPPNDPAWILQSGYSKGPELINSADIINMNDPKYADYIRQQQVGFMSRHSGGLISNFASGGTVAAKVSNGEAFIPPNLAKKIGYAKLDKMNQADRNGMKGYSGGGGVSIFKGPGNGTSDSIGPIAIPTGSYIIREKATKALGLHKNGGTIVRKFAKGGSSKADRKKRKEAYLAEQRGGLSREEARSAGIVREDFGGSQIDVLADVKTSTRERITKAAETGATLPVNMGEETTVAGPGGTIVKQKGRTVTADQAKALTEKKAAGSTQVSTTSRKKDITATSDPKQLDAMYKKIEQEVANNYKKLYAEEKKKIDDLYDQREAELDAQVSAGTLSVSDRFDQGLKLDEERQKSKDEAKAKLIAEAKTAQSKAVEEFKVGKQTTQVTERKSEQQKTSEAELKSTTEQIAKDVTAKYQKLYDEERASLRDFYNQRLKQVQAEGGDVSEVLAEYRAAVADAKKGMQTALTAEIKTQQEAAPEKLKQQKMAQVDNLRRQTDPFYDVGKTTSSQPVSIDGVPFNPPSPRLSAKAQKEQQDYFARKAEKAGMSTSGYKYSLAQQVGQQAYNIRQDSQFAKSEAKDVAIGKTRELQGLNVKSGADFKALLGEGATSDQAKKAQAAVAEFATNLQKIAPNMKADEIRAAAESLAEGIATGTGSVEELIAGNEQLSKIFATTISEGESLEEAFRRVAEASGLSAETIKANVSQKAIEQQAFIKSKEGQRFGKLAEFAPGLAQKISKAGGERLGGATDFVSGKGGKLSKLFAGAGGFQGIGSGVAVGSEMLKTSGLISKQTLKDPNVAGAFGAVQGAGVMGATGAELGGQLAGPVGALIGGIGGAVIGGIKGFFDAKNAQILSNALEKLTKSSEAVDIAFKELAKNDTDKNFKNVQKAFGQQIEAAQKLDNIAFEGGQGPSVSGVGGGALAGAAGGALIGSFIPVIGTAIGAAIGGAIGGGVAYLSEGQNKANREEALRNRVGSASGMNESASRMAERQMRRTTTEELGQQDKAGLNVIAEQYKQSAIAAAEAANGTKNLTAAQKESISKGAAETAYLDAYMKQRKEAGATDQQIADDILKDRKSALEAGKKATEAQSEAARKQALLARATKEVALATENLLDVYRRVGAKAQKFSDEVDDMLGGTQATISSLGGNASVQKVDRSGSERILGNMAAYSSQEVKAATQEMIGKLGGGEEAQALGKQAEAAKFLQDRLPSMLRNQNADPSKIMDQLRDEMSDMGIGGDAIDKMLGEIEKQIKNNEEGGLGTLADEISSGGIDKLSATAAEAAKTLQNLSKTYNDTLQKSIDLQNQYNEAVMQGNAYLRKASSIRITAELDLAKALGNSPTLAQLNEPIDFEIKDLTKGLVAGGTTDPAAIAAGIAAKTAENQQLQKANVQLGNEGMQGAAGIEGAGAKLLDEQQKNIAAMGANSVAINEGRQALEKLANDGTKAANALAKIEEQQRQIEGLGNRFEKIFTAGPEELFKMERQSAALEAAKVAGPEQFKSRAFRQDAFAGLEQDKEFLTGEEYRKQRGMLMRKSLEAQGYTGQSTINKGGINMTVDDFIKRIEGGISEEDPNVKAYREAVATQIKANEELARLEELKSLQIQEAMLGLQVFLANEFPKILTDAVKASREDSETKPEVKSKESEQATVKAQQAEKATAQAQAELDEADKAVKGFKRRTKKGDNSPMAQRMRANDTAELEKLKATREEKRQALESKKNAESKAKEELATVKASEKETKAAEEKQSNEVKVSSSLDQSQRARAGIVPTVIPAPPAPGTPEAELANIREQRAQKEKENKQIETEKPKQKEPTQQAQTEAATYGSTKPQIQTIDKFTEGRLNLEKGTLTQDVERMTLSKAAKEKELKMKANTLKASKIAAEAAGTTETSPTLAAAQEAYDMAKADMESIDQQMKEAQDRIGIINQQLAGTQMDGSPGSSGGQASSFSSMIQPPPGVNRTEWLQQQTQALSANPGILSSTLNGTAQPVATNLPKPVEYTRQVQATETGTTAQTGAKPTETTAQLLTLDPASLEGLNTFNTTFGSYVERLVNFQFPNIPEKIEMTGTHVVDVRVSGAAAFESLQKGVKDLINKSIDEKMSEIWTQTGGAIGTRPGAPPPKGK